MAPAHKSDILIAIMKKNLLFFVCISLGFLFVHVPSLFAAGATISLSPNSGSLSTSFPVSVVVDGGGQAFNAAQATVSVSPNLTITDLTLGDCNFSYLATPSIANPSFQGVILGGSSKKCTVYTLTVSPVKKGDASIALSKGSVKRFGDATNILSSVQSGKYSLTGEVLGAAIALPTGIPSKSGLYTVVLKVSSDNKPVANTTVFMKSVTTKTPLQAKTDKNGIVQFSNISTGIYDTTVQGCKGDTILNIRGNNHILTLGIKVERQSILSSIKGYLFLAGVLVSGIVLGILITLFIKNRNKYR